MQRGRLLRFASCLRAPGDTCKGCLRHFKTLCWYTAHSLRCLLPLSQDTKASPLASGNHTTSPKTAPLPVVALTAPAPTPVVPLPAETHDPAKTQAPAAMAATVSGAASNGAAAVAEGKQTARPAWFTNEALHAAWGVNEVDPSGNSGASGAYNPPVGSSPFYLITPTLVGSVKTVVVAFPGTHSAADVLVDASFSTTDLTGPLLPEGMKSGNDGNFKVPVAPSGQNFSAFALLASLCVLLSIAK